MNALPKTSWYWKEARGYLRPLSLEEVRGREHDYRTWWEAKFAKLWRDRVEPVAGDNLLPRQTIVKAPKVIGHVDGMPVTVRSCSFAGTCEFFETVIKNTVYEYRGTAQPPLYVVGWNGKRIDSFLKHANAKARALDFIKLNGGE